MKIYTKTGDNGTTGLYDGSRVQKSEQILDVLGGLDELSAHIGRLLLVLRLRMIVSVDMINFIVSIQKTLLNIGSIIATPNPSENLKLPEIKDEHILEIESAIDEMDIRLMPLTVFIVQDGKNESEVQSHICRTLTRRVEREMNKYGNISDEILKFMNRLSDFFFTLARYTSEPLTYNAN